MGTAPDHTCPALRKHGQPLTSRTLSKYSPHFSWGCLDLQHPLFIKCVLYSSTGHVSHSTSIWPVFCSPEHLLLKQAQFPQDACCQTLEFVVFHLCIPKPTMMPAFQGSIHRFGKYKVLETKPEHPEDSNGSRPLVTVAEVRNQGWPREPELRGSALGTLLSEPASHLVQVAGTLTAEVANMRTGRGRKHM